MMSIPSVEAASKLKELNFYSKKWMNDTQADNLSELLASNQSVTFVGFRECRQIGDKGATSIANSLKYNKTLKKISFESTNVANIGASELARALTLPHCSLLRLDLSYCPVGDKGLCAIAQSLSLKSSILSVLMLEHCTKLTNSSGQVMLAILDENQSLTNLGLKGTLIAADIRNAIQKKLKLRDLLKRRSCSFSAVTDSVGTAVNVQEDNIMSSFPNQRAKTRTLEGFGKVKENENVSTTLSLSSSLLSFHSHEPASSAKQNVKFQEAKQHMKQEIELSLNNPHQYLTSSNSHIPMTKSMRALRSDVPLSGKSNVLKEDMGDHTGCRGGGIARPNRSLSSLRGVLKNRDIARNKK